MKKATRKGFTIVELLVVIAVIAVLAAVLIPVMVYLIDDAKESADEQVTASLNKAIAAETDNIDTMSDALAVAEEYGYGVEQLTPTSDGNLIVWDQNTKYFALVTEDGGGDLLQRDAVCHEIPLGDHERLCGRGGGRLQLLPCRRV